jgi:ADP-ribosylglycohydrolase
MNIDSNLPINLAHLSLLGLSVGDAFGQRFFSPVWYVERLIKQRILPIKPWHFTDDTMMSIGIVEVLAKYEEINQDALAEVFARNYRREPARGYGGKAHYILNEINQGTHWRKVAGEVFAGMGSMGNGGAMRVAPVGAYFHEDIDKVIHQAELSAQVTHAHPEAWAGAIAVALAAAWACRTRNHTHSKSGYELLKFVLSRMPESDTTSKLRTALSLPFSYSIETAVSALGNGYNLLASDTVPFALWCVARHVDSYVEALWNTVSGLGDRDTTCAIVGGIMSILHGKEGIPDEWIEATEPFLKYLDSV